MKQEESIKHVDASRNWKKDSKHKDKTRENKLRKYACSRCMFLAIPSFLKPHSTSAKRV